MGDKMKKLIEKYDEDFCRISQKDSWTKDEIAMMKDLQKLMYYIEVREAMKNGYDEYDYDEDEDFGASGRSYRGQSRNMNGRFTSNRGGNRGNGTSGAWPHYPPYYDDIRGSGRRYYDSEKENAVHELHRLMDSKNDPDVRMAIQDVIRVLENK